MRALGVGFVLRTSRFGAGQVGLFCRRAMALINGISVVLRDFHCEPLIQSEFAQDRFHRHRLLRLQASLHRGHDRDGDDAFGDVGLGGVPVR
jgi:hypothetical protein